MSEQKTPEFTLTGLLIIITLLLSAVILAALPFIINKTSSAVAAQNLSIKANRASEKSSVDMDFRIIYTLSIRPNGPVTDTYSLDVISYNGSTYLVNSKGGIIKATLFDK